MIKLSRAKKPAYLSAENCKNLVEEFKCTGAAVWNHPEIKDALLSSSHGKCAYCEARITEESKYLEVEHFRLKVKFPDSVVEWCNLLPSCKRCNGKKGGHDVTLEPILDPFDVDPVEHIGFRSYRFRPLTELGGTTVDVLDLNNSMRVVVKRFEVGEAISEAVAMAMERLALWKGSQSTRSRNLLLSAVESLLLECQPSAPYSATASTVLHSDPGYKELTDCLKSHGCWNDELEELHASSAKLALRDL